MIVFTPISFVAFDLAKEQNLNFGDDITAALRKAKKKRWSAIEAKRIKEELELEKYLNKLISEDKERQLEKASSSNEKEKLDSEFVSWSS